jgi:hypothetical protein
MYDLGLGHARELRAALGEAPYEVPERLTGLLGARAVVWTSLGPLPRWVPGLTTRWAPGTTRLVQHGT